MKKITTLIGALCFSYTILLSQQPPTSTNPNGVPSGTNDKQFWSRAGNTNTQGTNNIFGTMWNSPVYHFTTGKRRMTAFDDTHSTASFGPINSTPFGGGLAIHLNPLSPIPAPKSLLTIGEDFDPMGEASSGWRQWMRVGTFNTDGSDFAYFGLKREQSLDRNDAVIAWGDDAGLINNPNIYSPDYLRFIFSSDVGLSTNVPNGQGSHGLEVARFSPFGSFGIGNYYNNTIEAPFTQNPSRRVEILSDKTVATNNGNPLLRLTHTQQDPINLTTTGLYSEFEPRNNGDLFISVRDNTQTNTLTKVLKERFTGLNTNTPGNTFEINSQFVSSTTLNGNAPAATGWAGLRFTDLNSSSVAQTNPSSNVLSVDANGDVILVPGGGGSGTVTGNNGILVTAGLAQLGVPCTLPSGAPNFPGLSATQLTVDRAIYIANQNFWFGNAHSETGAVAVGGNPTGTPWCNIGNTFEISANSKNIKYGSASASGLRLTKLLSTSPTVANGTYGVNNSKVLTVDQDGDVVLTDATTGIGNYCSATTPNPLTDDYEIPLSTYNYYFSGQGTGKTNVGVGLPCNTILGGKVHAYQLSNNMMLSTIYGISVAGRFDNYTSTNAYIGYGVIGNAQGTSPGYNFGVFGQAANAAVNFAGYFQGDVYTTGGTNSIAGYLSGSDKNIKTNITTIHSNLEIINKLRPVSFKFDNSYAPQLKLNSTKNYGFIAQEVETIIPELVNTGTVVATYDSIGNVINPEKVIKSLNYDGLIPFAIGGIQELNAKQKEMQASLDKAGLSDAQVKTNINSFNALAKIKTLNPVQYNFTNTTVPQLTFKSNLDYGFVAQQLETVYPELVDTLRIDATYDSLGVVVNPSQVLKTVNYKAMAGLLVRSIQEQQLTIDSLRNAHSKQDSINNAVQQQLANLAALIDGCCHATNRTSNNSLDIELSDKDAIVLNQNVPNPFAEQTTITYNVPESVGKAQIIFYNNVGQIIQTVDVKTRGKGKVNVFASDLSSGLYHYTLVADGKVVDSKKMVRE